MKFSFLIILSIIMFAGCCKKTVKANASEMKDTVSIVYQKTHCYGRCPVYTMTIDNSGNVIFAGEANVDKIGKYSLKLTPEEMDTLIAAFGTAHFFELEDRYYKNVTDMPTIFITYTKGDRTKKITDYYGAPKRLRVLEAKIEEVVEKEGWKKVE